MTLRGSSLHLYTSEGTVTLVSSYSLLLLRIKTCFMNNWLVLSVRFQTLKINLSWGTSMSELALWIPAHITQEVWMIMDKGSWTSASIKTCASLTFFQMKPCHKGIMEAPRMQRLAPAGTISMSSLLIATIVLIMTLITHLWSLGSSWNQRKSYIPSINFCHALISQIHPITEKPL